MPETTPDPAAIEAGAVALCNAEWEPVGVENWDNEGPDGQAYWRSYARAAYDAMEPHIRKTIAEQIAHRIEARKPSVRQFWDTADAAHVYAYSDAAKIAREIGAKP